MYRDAPTSLSTSAANYGVWIAELAANMRKAVEGSSPVRYMHNLAHDGSVSRVLSILQIDTMVWPGMGSEVVFELWKKPSSPGHGVGGGRNAPVARDEFENRPAKEKVDYFVRVLFGGRVLKSSSPTLGVMDMVPLSTLLDYFDGLVGPSASLVKPLCGV